MTEVPKQENSWRMQMVTGDYGSWQNFDFNVFNSNFNHIWHWLHSTTTGTLPALYSSPLILSIGHSHYHLCLVMFASRELNHNKLIMSSHQCPDKLWISTGPCASANPLPPLSITYHSHWTLSITASDTLDIIIHKSIREVNVKDLFSQKIMETEWHIPDNHWQTLSFSNIHQQIVWSLSKHRKCQ